MASLSVLASSKNRDEGNKCSPTLSNSLLADDSRKWREKVPVGIRFKPTEQVLLCHYLAGKVSGCTDGPIFQLIKEVDVYQHEPSKLSSLTYDFGDGKMYFFTRLLRRKNMNRNVPAGGFWKKIAKPSYVEDNDGKPVATKTTLVYYKRLDKKSNPVKTQWLMKEYMLLDNQSPNQNEEEYPMHATPWTLCVAYTDLKRRRESENGNGYEKNNWSSDLCQNAKRDLNSLVSGNKRNTDDSISVKRTCGNDHACRSIELFQSSSRTMRLGDEAAARGKIFKASDDHKVYLLCKQLS